jgi:hypothetical protein
MAGQHDDLIHKMALQSEHLDREYVLPHPFAVIDAGLREHLFQEVQRDPNAPGYKRTRITDGSSRFTLRSGRRDDAADIADIDIRMIGERRTYIGITLRPLVSTAQPENREYLERWCKFQLLVFLSWLWADEVRMQSLKIPTPNNTTVVSDDPLTLVPAGINDVLQNSSGPPPKDINNWVRHEVLVKERDRNQVFREYLDRLGIDQDDEVEVEKYRERFRKVISRAKRT